MEGAETKKTTEVVETEVVARRLDSSERPTGGEERARALRAHGKLCGHRDDAMRRVVEMEEELSHGGLGAQRKAVKQLLYRSRLTAAKFAHGALAIEASADAVRRGGVQLWEEQLSKAAQQLGAARYERTEGGRRMVLVDEEAVRAASAAARTAHAAVRDAVRSAALQAEARVQSSWEDAWAERSRQLREARHDRHVLRKRLHSARGLGRRTALAARWMRLMLSNARWDRRDGTAPTWESLEPLLDAAEAMAVEADSLGTRAEQIFASVGAPIDEDVLPPASSTDGESEVEREDPRHWWADRPRHHSSVRVQASVRGWLVRRCAPLDAGRCAARADADASAPRADADAPTRTRPWHAHVRASSAWPDGDSGSSDEEYGSAMESDAEEVDVRNLRSTGWSCTTPTARRVPARGDG